MSSEAHGGGPGRPAVGAGGVPATGGGSPAAPARPTPALTAACTVTGPTPTGACAPAAPAPALPAAAQPPDGFVVAVSARDRLALPLPDARFAPPDGADQLVGFATWLWIDAAQWHGLSTSVMVPGVAATVRARPVALTWRTGDGDVVACDGSGTPYRTEVPDRDQQSGCTHTYLATGDVTATVTVHWQLDWSATTGQQGTFGLVDRTTTVPLHVVQVQAVTD